MCSIASKRFPQVGLCSASESFRKNTEKARDENSDEAFFFWLGLRPFPIGEVGQTLSRTCVAICTSWHEALGFCETSFDSAELDTIEGHKVVEFENSRKHVGLDHQACVIVPHSSAWGQRRTNCQGVKRARAARQRSFCLLDEQCGTPRISRPQKEWLPKFGSRTNVGAKAFE